MPFLILVILAAIVLYYFWRRRTPSQPPPPRIEENVPDTYEFREDSESITPMVRRNIRIVAPRQTVNGKQSTIIVEAQPLPDVGNLKPPAEKQIEALVVLAFNPRVRVQETGEELNDFAPPLTLTMDYKPEDAAAAGFNPDGTPRLSIVTGYESADGWRFERIVPEITQNSDGGGTLKAEIRTLNPKDPVWAGAP